MVDLANEFVSENIYTIAVIIADELMAQAGSNTVRARSGMTFSVNEHSFDCRAIAERVQEALDEWLPMVDAPRNRTPVLVKFRDDLHTIRPDLDRWNGIQAVLQHQEVIDDWQPGWNFAAPVGHGGFPDSWLVGWKQLSGQPGPWPYFQKEENQ